MAMIKCPNCGGDISDKATNCIFCNYNIASHTQKLCVECGNIIEPNSSICNKCGCPVNSNHQRQLVSDNNTEKTSDKGSLKKIVIGFSAVCVVLFIGIGIKMATDNNTNNPTIKVESSNSIIEYTTSNESNEQPSSTIESKSVPEESTNSSEDLDLLEYKIVLLEINHPQKLFYPPRPLDPRGAAAAAAGGLDRGAAPSAGLAVQAVFSVL